MNTLDARGYSCHEPVIMTKKALEKGLPLTLMVDGVPPLNRQAKEAAYVYRHLPHPFRRHVLQKAA